MKRKLNMKFLVTAVLVAIFLIPAGNVLAKDYPSKAVNYVIPFGPGSGFCFQALQLSAC